MAISGVSGCVSDFVDFMELDPDFSIEREKTIQQKDLLVCCIKRYSKKEDCCGKLQRFFYIIWQAIKRFFGGSSVWQQTTDMLTEKTWAHVTNGIEELNQNEVKRTKQNLYNVVEKLLMQILEDNENKEKKTSKAFEQLVGNGVDLSFWSKQMFPLATLDCVMTPYFAAFLKNFESNIFVESLKEELAGNLQTPTIQKAAMQKFETLDLSQQLNNIKLELTVLDKECESFLEPLRKRTKQDPNFKPTQKEEKKLNSLESRVKAAMNKFVNMIKS